MKTKEITAYYRDKQSGEILTEEEMLSLVDEDDNLDSFYLIGEFKTIEEATIVLSKTYKP